MVGEIRDKETAQIAFRASVTGHLVLTTVHTNDTAAAVTRLVDLGLEPYMVASSLIGAVSVRLVRTICPKCKESYEGGRRNRTGSARRRMGIRLCSIGARLPALPAERLHRADRDLRSARGRREHQLPRRQRLARHRDPPRRGQNGTRSLGQDGNQQGLERHHHARRSLRVVYLAEQEGRVCPSCSGVLSPEFEYCPRCRAFVGEHCISCKRKLSGEWTYCPFCGESSGRPRTSRDGLRKAS